jgi:hypothetical protein
VSRQDKEYSREKASRQFGKRLFAFGLFLDNGGAGCGPSTRRSFVPEKRLHWLDWLVEKEFFPAKEMVGAKKFKPSTSWSRTKS